MSDSYVLELAAGKKPNDEPLAAEYRTFACELLLNDCSCASVRPGGGRTLAIQSPVSITGQEQR